MNAMRTEVRRRPGLGRSSSVTRYCNRTASAYNCRHAAGAHPPERGAERTLLLTAVCVTVPLDRHHRGRAHAKGTLRLSSRMMRTGKRCESRTQLSVGSTAGRPSTVAPFC